MKSAYTFRSKLWVYDGEAAWYFATLPAKISREINAGTVRVGFGAVKVNVSAGKMKWSTSIFPESKSKCYVLPMKVAVRKHLGIAVGDKVKLTIELVSKERSTKKPGERWNAYAKS